MQHNNFCSLLFSLLLIPRCLPADGSALMGRALQSPDFSCFTQGSTQECVSREQLIAINQLDDFAPGCDASQGVKGQVNGPPFSFFCSQTYVDALNAMLLQYGLCNEREVIAKFLAQVAASTTYFTNLGEDLGDVAGYLGLSSSLWEDVVDDMDIVSCAEEGQPSFREQFDGFADDGEFFRDPRYAWLAIAAYFFKTNWLVDSCEPNNLFIENLTVQTFCILGRNEDGRELELNRSRAVVCPEDCSLTFCGACTNLNLIDDQVEFPEELLITLVAVGAVLAVTALVLAVRLGRKPVPSIVPKPYNGTLSGIFANDNDRQENRLLTISRGSSSIIRNIFDRGFRRPRSSSFSDDDPEAPRKASMDLREESPKENNLDELDERESRDLSRSTTSSYFPPPPRHRHAMRLESRNLRSQSRLSVRETAEFIEAKEDERP